MRLLIVADIRLYREGLAHILARDAGLTMIETAGDLYAALRLVAERELDVVLVDMAMPHSLSAVQGIVVTAPDVKVVALGLPELERDLIACAEAGIAGYVPRDASVTDLVAVLESVARGELLCSPRTAAALLRRVTALAMGRRGEADVPGVLTPREREIVALLERGLSNKEIARALGIEVATVKNHVHNLLEKLRVHRRGEAVARLRNTTQPRRATPVS